MASLYETDFYAWTQEQAAKLRALADVRANVDIDIENVAEEIDSMGRSQRTQLSSRLAQLIEHLLKLAYSPSPEPRNGWRNSVVGQRYSIADLLEENPSLRRELPDLAAKAHRRALRAFTTDKLIQLGMEPLPGLCPFALDDMLNDDWWPLPPESN